MPSANKTPNYNLTQYSNNGSDKISALKDYNEDMGKIDGGMFENRAKIAQVESSTAQSFDDFGKQFTAFKTDINTTITDFKTEVGGKFDKLESDVDGKFDKLESDVDGKFDKLKSDVDGKFDAFQTKIDKQLSDQNTNVTSTVEAFRNEINKTISDFRSETAVAINDMKSLLPKGFEIRDYSSQMPLLVAHRGGTSFPEQSLAGCRWSWEHGFAPEVDVQRTKDGTLILNHDDTLTRTVLNAPTGKISDLDYDAIRQLRLKPRCTGGVSEQLPTFANFLREMNGRMSVIEVKMLTTECADETCRMINAAGARDRTAVICFDRELCKRMAAKGFHVQWLCGRIGDANELTSIKADGIEWVSVIYTNVDRVGVERAISAGLKVNCWTLDKETDYRNMIDAHVHGVTSNRVDLISRNVEETGTFSAPGVPQWIMGDGRGVEVVDDPRVIISGDRVGYYGTDDASANNYRILQSIPYSMIYLSNNTTPRVHIEGVTGRATSNTTAHASESLLRVGLFRSSRNDVSDTWNDSNNGNVGNTVQFILRGTGIIQAFGKVNGQAPGGSSEVIDTGLGNITSDVVRIDLDITFGPASVTVRGTIGDKTIYNQIITNITIPDGYYSLFTGFSLANAQPSYRITVSNGMQSTGIAN